jgi:hypothetical protein
MRSSRVFRWIVRIFLLILTTSMSLVSFLGGLSAVNILTNPDNIRVPSASPDANLTITNPSSMYITVPFNITNAGYFELTNLRIDFKIAMRYDHVNLTGNGLNITTSRIIFDKTQTFPPIAVGSTYANAFSATGGDGFLVANFPNANVDIDWTRTPYAVEFLANMTVSGSYSLNLLSFRFGLNNYPLLNISTPWG